MFDFDYYPHIKSAVDTEINKERHTHDAIYGLIEEFLHENRDTIIVSGKRSLQKFLKTPEDFLYEVYTTQAYKYALDVANRLADLLDGNHLINMETVLNPGRYVVKVNNRPYIRLDMLRNIDDVKVFSPIVIDKLYVIPPMLQMIQICATMYDITKYDEWAPTSELLKLVGADKVMGGGIKENPLEKFKENFVKGNDDIILIGDIAGAALYGGYYDCIDMISPLRVDFIVAELQKYRQEKLEYKQTELHLFSDYRLRKCVVRCDGHIVANIYNSASYEIIPYFRHGKYNIANKYVLMRFNLIEVWNLQVLVSKGTIELDYFKRKTTFKKTQFSNFLQVEDKKEFFVGEYRDEVLSTKLAKKEKWTQPPYFPQIYHKMTGNYKSM